MKLCTNDAEMFLHFHAFLPALSGMGSLLIPLLTSLKNPTEPPVVKTTELNSMAGKMDERIERIRRSPPPHGALVSTNDAIIDFP